MYGYDDGFIRYDELRQGNRIVRPGDMVRIRGRGKRAYRVRAIIDNPRNGAEWVDLYGPYDRYGRPARAQHCSVRPHEISARVRP